MTVSNPSIQEPIIKLKGKYSSQILYLIALTYSYFPIGLAMVLPLSLAHFGNYNLLTRACEGFDALQSTN